MVLTTQSASEGHIANDLPQNSSCSVTLPTTKSPTSLKAGPSLHCTALFQLYDCSSSWTLTRSCSRPKRLNTWGGGGAATQAKPRSVARTNIGMALLNTWMAILNTWGVAPQTHALHPILNPKPQKPKSQTYILKRTNSCPPPPLPHPSSSRLAQW